MNNHYPSRTADKFVVRLPDGLRSDIELAAGESHTSMNTVFVQAVIQYLDGQKRQQLLLDALAFAASLSAIQAPQPQENNLLFQLIGQQQRTQELAVNDGLRAYQARDALQLQLNQRDERIDQLEGLLYRWTELFGVSAPDLRYETMAALKAVETATDEHVCPGCGTKGWTACCTQCVPH